MMARTTRGTAVLDAGTSRPSTARITSPARRPARAATELAATSGTCALYRIYRRPPAARGPPRRCRTRCLLRLAPSLAPSLVRQVALLFSACGARQAGHGRRPQGGPLCSCIPPKLQQHAHVDRAAGQGREGRAAGARLDARQEGALHHAHGCHLRRRPAQWRRSTTRAARWERMRRRRARRCACVGTGSREAERERARRCGAHCCAGAQAPAPCSHLPARQAHAHTCREPSPAPSPICVARACMPGATARRSRGLRARARAARGPRLRGQDGHRERCVGEHARADDERALRDRAVLEQVGVVGREGGLALGVVVREGDVAAQRHQPQRVLHLLALHRARARCQGRCQGRKGQGQGCVGCAAVRGGRAPAHTGTCRAAVSVSDAPGGRGVGPCGAGPGACCIGRHAGAPDTGAACGAGGVVPQGLTSPEASGGAGWPDQGRSGQGVANMLRAPGRSAPGT